jgi:benzoate-CoA ligase family protein
MDLPDRFNAASFFVDRHLDEDRGLHTAFRVGGCSISYAALASTADRLGNALGELGVEMENRVVLALGDSPVFAASFWGAVKLGAVAVPLNTQMSGPEYAFVLNESRARVAIVDDDVLARIVTVRDGCPFLRRVIVNGRTAADALEWEDVLARARPRLDPAPTTPEDVMYWGYTSGSTGRPKAAVHSHQDFVAAADLVGVAVFGLRPADLVLSASKMYFAFGLGNSLYFPARVAAASVLVRERLEADALLATIESERPTVFCAVPTLYARMLQVPTGHDLSSLRLCVSSGEALPPALVDAWQERFGLSLIDVMGSTEVLHDFIAGRPGALRRGAIGQIVPGFEARLIDDEGRPVEPGHIGHLLIKGPTTSAYYWHRRERTRQVMLGEWIRTGDMLRRDDDGYFYFAGRADDMIKVGGQWVSPSEVEARLVEHPRVLEAAVVGREDEEGLMKLDAFVVPNAGQSVDEAALKIWVRSGLAGHKVPGRITLVTDLPKTATGKIQRFRLRPPPGHAHCP